MCIARGDCLNHLFYCGIIYVIVSDFQRGRRITPPHTRGSQNTDLARIKSTLQRQLQGLRPCDLARQ